VLWLFNIFTTVFSVMKISLSQRRGDRKKIKLEKQIEDWKKKYDDLQEG